jgi:hypothetical protein
VAFAVTAFPIGTFPTAVVEKTIMLKPYSSTGYSSDVASALPEENDHLSIGRGFRLHYRNGAMFSRYGYEAVEVQCIAVGAEVWYTTGIPAPVSAEQGTGP